MFTITRSLVAGVAFAVVSAAVPALAGPPLICHPFATRGGTLLPWDASTNWNAPLASYNTARLPDDVVKLLDTDAPVLTRMENLRRATIYAQKDPVLARQLLDDEAVGTDVVIGPNAQKPLTLKIPLLVSDMSFGSLSEPAKIALAKGAELAGTGICSGEGGMLAEEQQGCSRYFYELASARFRRALAPRLTGLEPPLPGLVPRAGSAREPLPPPRREA